MVFRHRKRLNRLLSLRLDAQSFPLSISSFTVFLIIFAQLLHFLWIFSIASAEGICSYASFWVTGWFEFSAPHQWLGAAIIITMTVFFMRAVLQSAYATAPWQTAFQGALIGVIALVFLGHAAYLFPYAYPGASSMSKVFATISPQDMRFNEAEDVLFEWPDDFPEKPANPRLDGHYGPKHWQVFVSSASPTWGEYKAMQACRLQYLEDLQTYRQWERDFDKRHLGN